MKKIFLLLAILSTSLISAQAFKGKGDTKLQVGANVQNNATGINLSYDYGVGENISLGFSTSYALGIDDKISKDFTDRFDLKARFTANLGNVLKIDENFDILQMHLHLPKNYTISLL